MRQRLADYAPYITWLGLFLILVGLLVPLLTRQSGAEVPAGLTPVLLVTGVVLALAWPLLRPGELRDAMGGRRARFGANALVLTVSVIGVLVVANVLSYLYYTQIDMTSNKQFSISRQTIQILDDLDDQTRAITLTAIVPSLDRATADDLDRLVERYRARTDRIQYRRIDPQVDNLALLGLAQRLEMGQSIPGRALIAEMGDRHAIVYTGFDEQALTEAIVKVLREEERTVLFTTGHGEYDPDGSGERSYYSVRQQLEKEGYTVDTLNLATITETLSASTANVVVVAGPRQVFLPEEAQRLADYVEQGGSLMLLLDPGFDPNLGAITAPWEIQPRDDVVLQENIFGMTPTVVVQGDSYNFHTITKDLSSLQTVFPGSRSFTTGTPITASLQTTALVELQGGAWGETDLDGLADGNVDMDADDNMPPLVLAVAGEESAWDEGTPEAGFGRIVVFGSSGIVADEILQSFPPGAVANFDLFLNAVNWLGLDEELISIRPVEPDERPIKPPSRPLALLLATAILIPAAVLGVGAYVYWRRH